MSQVLEPSLAEHAKSALSRHDWRGAFDLLSEADRKGILSPHELELLAGAAWWVGELPTAIDARERAYAAAMKSGDQIAAATAAIGLARDNLLRLSTSVASAWMSRGERLLEAMDEGPGHGWLATVRAMHAALVGKTEEGIAQATRAQAIALRTGDRDLEAAALSAKGALLVARGDVDEGLAMLDEATVAAVAGELEPETAGTVSCSSIGACAALGDWRRAAEWTEAQDRWCRREGINGFPGMCRLHRAEIKQLRGAWLEAEAEARRASEELRGFVPAAVGLALYQIGDLRRRRGDFSAAADALQRAHAFGRDPEPALSLLRLAEGKVAAAAASIKRALEEPAEPSWWAPPDSGLHRVTLLPAQVEIALAAGDVATARTAADELAALAERYGSLTIKASSAQAQGAVQLAEGDLAHAGETLRRAIQLWGELEAPHESARARLILAEAHLGGGDSERALLEGRAARAAFERLGAVVDLRRADELLATVHGTDAPTRRASADRAVKTFVFTDIAESTRLAELLGDEAWDRLIRWHDQTLRSLVAEHGGEEIKATGDGFFLAFDTTDQALACAIAIQRRLAEHSQAHGFAPRVRIGVHRAEANRSGLDYTGIGVNQAARIGESAVGGEILVSAPTLATARREHAAVGRRSVELRGLSVPVEVVSVDWR